MKHSPSFIFFLVTVTVMVLTACNRELGQYSGTAQDINLNENVTKKQICGRLVVAKKDTLATDGCPDVPAGYSPLSNITVNFLDQSGITLNSISSNACGEFTTTLTDAMRTINIASTGNKEFNLDSSRFEQDSCITIETIASTIPVEAKYEISSIQFLSDNSIAFSISDDITSKAVIGIPASSFLIKVNNTDQLIATFDSSGGTTIQASSAMLVLDASGSMDDRVFDENNNQLVDENQNPYNRLRLAALASHTYLDGTSNTNETGIVIFNSSISTMNDDYLSNNIPLVDASNTPANYTFSNTGFTNQAADLRFIVDIYNFYSDIYADVNSLIYDTRHTDSAKLNAQQGYHWGGGTAFYDATISGINQISTRSNNRKFIIAMTDGRDTASSNSTQNVIELAKDKNISVYTIGFGSGSDTSTLEQIATETNASFFNVKSNDISNIFQGIQTNITFQYKATLSNSVTIGDTLQLSIDYNGETATRNIQK